MKAIIRKQLFITVIAVLLGTTAAQAWWWDLDEKWDDESTTEISWEQLIPEGFRPVQSPLENMSREQLDKLFDGSEESEIEIAEIEEMMAYAPVVESLDGKRVKLPGYVVPLDFDGQSKMKEFLLVPYYGACIHTPPPPANQVVHANAQEAIVVEDTYMPVWAIGTLSTETIKSNLAESGYRLKIERVEPYE
ncbi:MAG: hypothetical protein ACI9XK_001736 [Granulosicoccus sp.]|jgi:hypothetical protein